MKERTLERRATRNERTRVKERKARTLERNATTKADKEGSRQRGKNRRGKPVDEGNSMMLRDFPVTDCFFSFFLFLSFSRLISGFEINLATFKFFLDRYLSVCELFLNEKDRDMVRERIRIF